MKLISTLLCSAFLLTACGGSDSPPPSTPVQAKAPVKVAAELTPVQRGAKIYTRCRACHTLEQDGRSKVGPNLWGIYGSQTASKEGFAYSKAMKAANITWTEETMDAYLKRPASYMPGTRMTFIGLKKQEDRDAVQAYLKEKTSP